LIVRHQQRQILSEAARPVRELQERCERTALFQGFQRRKLDPIEDARPAAHVGFKLALNKTPPIFKSGSWTHHCMPKTIVHSAFLRLGRFDWRQAAWSTMADRSPLICNDRLFAVKLKLWLMVGQSVFQGTSLAGQP
jgi:hypothetical protein